MNKKGFTLIELLVVIAIIGLLATIVMVSLNAARVKARNARRLGDMRSLASALSLYYNQYNVYPSPGSDASCAGWDTTGDGVFIPALKTAGFLSADARDPSINSGCQNYKYYRYNAGDYGCDAIRGGFFVLGVVDMEGSGGAYPGNPGWSCSGRNWTGEFEWVIGQFEK